MQSLLCETVTGRSMTELLAERDAADAADMVELRLDGVADVDVAVALRDRRLPVIVTCRPAWEGGRFEGNEDERCQLLAEALGRGADYVDIEWRAVREHSGQGGFPNLVITHPSRVVVSSHDFDGMPPDVSAQARAMWATGASVIKMAITAKRLSDALPLADVARGGRAVVVAMGDAGVPTRLLATRFGSRWTYGGAGAAPGQMPARRMVEGFRFRSISASTVLFGATGYEVMRSGVPERFNAGFAEAGLDAVCVPLCAADVDDLRTFKAALGFAGVVDAGATVEAVERVRLAWTRSGRAQPRRGGVGTGGRQT
jgi:3-dehydroquinate dehydratase/shikimate dehydrogenase